VISVDTSAVHLAGAMGKPVFLLDRYDHCWRWLSGRADSPWYPALRIFRQERIADWTPVLQQATRALREFAAARVHPD
jgi:ADP-heptose:LPS heptosyltransferase